MNPNQVQKAKKSVCRVMGVHKSYNFREPYLEHETEQFGGTAFFVNPKTTFGENFPIDTTNKRFALTNFHVVDTLVSHECTLSYPDKGHSMISAKVVFAVPSLDIAILLIDPFGNHPLWFDSGDIRDFIDGIPNLRLETKNTIKGNSQEVMAIGFPNLSQDYQLCQGCISGRGLGMIQCTISLNGGNSGGPLLMKNKVIGICTASISDSESLGLAVPINQVVNFFTKWTNYSEIILKTPSWGIEVKTTTPDYLQYHEIDSAIQGCTVLKTVDVGSIHKAKMKPKDIIMGIRSNGKSFNVDNYGLISVDWCDKRVPIYNQEFILSLDPDDIKFTVYKWSTKKIRENIKVNPTSIPFEICTQYHCWEPIGYTILGGCVFMDLCMNHLSIDDDDDDPWCPPVQAMSLTHYLTETMHMQKAVVVTHIPSQGHVSSQNLLKPFHRIVKCNGKKVKSVNHMENIIADAVERYNDDYDTIRNRFIVLETPSDKIYYNLEQLVIQEIQDSQRPYYPTDKCQLLGLTVRKRRRMY